MKWKKVASEPPEMYKMYLLSDGEMVRPGYFWKEDKCTTWFVPYYMKDGEMKINLVKVQMKPTHYMEIPDPPTENLPESTELVTKEPYAPEKFSWNTDGTCKVN